MVSVVCDLPFLPCMGLKTLNAWKSRSLIPLYFSVFSFAGGPAADETTGSDVRGILRREVLSESCIVTWMEGRVYPYNSEVGERRWSFFGSARGAMVGRKKGRAWAETWQSWQGIFAARRSFDWEWARGASGRDGDRRCGGSSWAFFGEPWELVADTTYTLTDGDGEG